MLRSLIIASLFALAAGCASAPVAKKVSLASSGRETSEELNCMSECLDSTDEDCESCVAQCLQPTPQVAPLAAF